jgi:hypothetical protein
LLTGLNFYKPHPLNSGIGYYKQEVYFQSLAIHHDSHTEFAKSRHIRGGDAATEGVGGTL